MLLTAKVNALFSLCVGAKHRIYLISSSHTEEQDAGQQVDTVAVK